MSAMPQTVYEQRYSEYEKQRYLDYLSSLSDDIHFDDDTWICEKRIKSKAQLLSKVTIYFGKVPDRYRQMVKYYALIRLLAGRGIGTVCTNVGAVALFLGFLEVRAVTGITVITASRFKEHLDGTGRAESSKSYIWIAVSGFLRQMDGFDGMKLFNPFYGNIYDSHKLVDQKYIPEDVADKLDRIFMKDDLPISMQCIYWLLRLIPSRSSEVLGMSIDCVKPFEGHFCIFIPTWKQNGGYKEPIMRVIHVKDEGMGGHLLALIREQQKAALSYQQYLPQNKQGALFAYRSQILLDGVWHAQNRYSVASWVYVSYQFKEICKRNHLQNEDGEPYSVTSHQFRHNGITDRLRAGFTMAQIAEMTAHHGTAMIYASYVHLNLFPETLVEPIRYQTEAENPFVLFGGRILNMDAITEARLLKNLRAHRIPGGICADVTHCKSGLWGCIDCEHFVPEMEQLPYFKEQARSWTEKAEKFRDDKQIKANYADIADEFQRIVEKIDSGCYNGE